MVVRFKIMLLTSSLLVLLVACETADEKEKKMELRVQEFVKEQEIRDMERYSKDLVADSIDVFSRDTILFSPKKFAEEYDKKIYTVGYSYELGELYKRIDSRRLTRDKFRNQYEALLQKLRLFPMGDIQLKKGKKMKSVTTFGESRDKEAKLELELATKEVEATRKQRSPCDENAATFVLENMIELTSRIDKGAGDYYLSHDLWMTMSQDKKLQLMRSVADAHACLEGKARRLRLIDDLTGATVAEASPTWGIRVLD